MNYLYYDYKKLWHCHNPSGNLKNITKIIQSYIKNYQYEIDKNGNILIGNFNKKLPCLVAHIDSVHFKESTVFNFKDNILSSNNGIGGDDKCGIVAILELLKLVKNINVIFTTDEEIGGIGSSKIEKDILQNVLYFIEIDRQGNDDIIYQSGIDKIASKEFKKALIPLAKKYQYKEAIGTFTDLNILCNTANISGINISAGYYKPHTVKEYVNLFDLQYTINFVTDILNNIKEQYPNNEIQEYGFFESNYQKYDDNTTIVKILNEAYLKGYNNDMIDMILKAYDCGQLDTINYI